MTVKKQPKQPRVTFDHIVPTSNSMQARTGDLIIKEGLTHDDEQFITNQTAIDLARIQGMYIKQAYAGHLMQEIRTRAQQQYADQLQAQSELLAQGRSEQDQADLLAFCTKNQELSGSDNLALSGSVISAIGFIALEPIDRPPEKTPTEEVIVEPARNLLRRVRGEMTVTRVKR